MCMKCFIDNYENIRLVLDNRIQAFQVLTKYWIKKPKIANKKTTKLISYKKIFLNPSQHIASLSTYLLVFFSIASKTKNRKPKPTNTNLGSNF